MILYYLACFDISDNRNRSKIGNILLQYGQRVQESVFEIAVRYHHDITHIQAEVQPLLDDDDDLRFYYLPTGSRKRSQNHKGEPLREFPAVVIC